MAEKRNRQHGRFVKSSKKSITELAKAYKGKLSMTSSVMSRSSPGNDDDNDIASRKGSYQEVVQSLAVMSVLPRPGSPSKSPLNNQY